MISFSGPGYSRRRHSTSAVAQVHLGDAWIIVTSARPGRGSPTHLGPATQSLSVFVQRSYRWGRDLEQPIPVTSAESGPTNTCVVNALNGSSRVVGKRKLSTSPAIRHRGGWGPSRHSPRSDLHLSQLGLPGLDARPCLVFGALRSQDEAMATPNTPQKTLMLRVTAKAATAKASSQYISSAPKLRPQWGAFPALARRGVGQGMSLGTATQ